MSDAAKIAAITIISFTALWLCFSPYQTCIRGEHTRNFVSLELQCATALGLRR